MKRPRGTGLAIGFALLASIAFVGCGTWKVKADPPRAVVENTKPHVIRVTLAGDRQILVYSPGIVGDSLVGSNKPTSAAGSDEARRRAPAQERIAVALSDVRAVEVQVISAWKTTLLVLGIGVTAAAIVAASSFSSWGSGSMWGNSESCPLIYSWDGEAWKLDSGTFGGAILEPLARTEVDNLEHAAPASGLLRLRMTDEADETEFVDAVSVVAVDHDPGLSVAPDVAGNVRAFGALVPPASARDLSGRDAIARVDALDEWSWESMLRNRDPGDPSDLRDGLVVEFPRPSDAGATCLVLDGHDTPWVASLVALYAQAHGSEEPAWQRDAVAHPDSARAQMARLMRAGTLEVSLWTAEGWERRGEFWPAGPEVARRQVLPLDLSRAAGRTIRVRLTGTPSFWLIDRVALARLSPDPIRARTLVMSAARDSGGRDVSALLRTADGHRLRMESGDVAMLSFDAPDVPRGLLRSYLVRATGWYRVDCDTTRAPDRDLLERIGHDPAAVARVSIERMNAALEVLAESR